MYCIMYNTGTDLDQMASLFPTPSPSDSTIRAKQKTLMREQTYSPVRGVCSASFITTTFPVARAGPSFHACTAGQ